MYARGEGTPLVTHQAGRGGRVRAHRHREQQMQLVHQPHLPVAVNRERADELERSPGEQRELRGEVGEEEAVVVLPDARADPRAVVVEAAHAVAAVVAVLRPQGLPQVAVRAHAARVRAGVPTRGMPPHLSDGILKNTLQG